MKKIINIFNNMIPIIVIVLVSYISSILDFNYINYPFIINKYIFITISILLLTYISIKRNNIYTSLENIYYYKLHIVLNIIWIFLFFLYKEFYISLICILFNFVINIILFKKYKYNKIYFIYLLWYCYIVYINIRMVYEYI